MSRIFISHSSVDGLQAVALRKWLVQQNPPLDNEIFLDTDPRRGIPLGIKWKDALLQANARCEAVICMLSKAWESSTECNTEFRMAEGLNKRIFCARLEPSTGLGITRDWQWVDLFGDGPHTEVDVNYKGKHAVVTFLSSGLRKLRDEIIGGGLAAETFVWPPPNDPHRAPYRGWQPLDEFDAAVFLGRDAPIVRGLDALRGMRQSGVEKLFVILGPSGSGKSSFLRAGLIPRLRRDDRSFVVLDIVRPERNVITGDNGLAKSIHSTSERLKMPRVALGEIKQAALEDPNRLGELLRDIQRAGIAALVDLPEGASPPTLLLPVDQAEELFGVDAGSEAPQFLDLIGRYGRTDIADGVPLIVVVTIRTDHHEALQTAPQLGSVKSLVFDDLKPMPEAEFKEVIEGPARRASAGGRPLHIDPELVERLLIDSTEGAETLPLLSLTLARLYADYGDGGELGLGDYLAMGEMRNIVQTEIDSLLSRDTATRRRELDMLRAAFVPGLATINPDNDLPVRRVASWDDFEPEVKPLLDKFVEKRLLVKDSRDTGDVVEIALDSLLRHWDDLKGWLELEQEDLKRAEILKREAAAWEKNQRDDAWLLQGRRLEDAEKLFARSDYEDLIASARAFVDVSKRRARRRKTVLRTAVAVVVMIAMVAGFLLIGLMQSSRQKEAERRQKEAEQRQNTAWQLLSEAEQMLEGSRAGGDVRALQQLLAAHSLGAQTAEALANTRRDEIKIFENPPRIDGEGVTPVRSVAISPDGERVAWANDNQTVRVWDATTNNIHTLPTGGTSPSWSVAFSPDGNWLAAAGSDQEGKPQMLLWDAGNLLNKPKTMPHSKDVLSIGFSADSKWIATGAADGTVRVWDITGKQRFDRLAAHEPNSAANSVAFSPDGRFVVSGGRDKTVRLWNAQTGEPVQTRRDPNEVDAVTAVAFSPAGDRVVVSRTNGTVRILNGGTLQPLTDPIQAHPNAIESVAFSRDGARIVTGGDDNTVRVWDSTSLAQIGNPLIGHHAIVSSVVFTSDGARIVSGGLDGSVRVWDAVAGMPIPAKQGIEIRAVAVSPDGSQLASGGSNGTVKLWDVATGKLIGQLGQPCPNDFECSINSLAFYPKDARIVTGSTNGVVRIWDLKSPQQDIRLRMRYPPGVPTDPPSRVKSVAFSPDGSLIVAAGVDGVVRLWDAQTLEPIAAEVAHAKDWDGKDVQYEVWSVAFSPDSRRLATGSGYAVDKEKYDKNFLQLWTIDRSRDQPLTRDGDPIVDHRGWDIFSVAFDRKGEQVVSSSYDGTVRVFDVRTRRRLQLLISDQNPVLSIAFAHDHPWLVTGSTDGKIRLWDTTPPTYQPIGTPLTGHGGSVPGVTFSTDDRLILSGSADGTVRLWSSPTDLTRSVCDKLTANMSHHQWDDWVARGNPMLRYTMLCPDLPVPETK